jgi:hypothetical protein
MHDVDGGHHMMESQGRARATMFLALLAVVGIAVKFLTIAALHFLRPDVNPVLEPISNYGVGPYGFLLTVADIGSVVATLALVFGLYLGIAPPGRSYVGLFLLGLYGASELLAGIFPIDVGGETTTVGTIHSIVGNIYRSSVSLSPRSSCHCAWVRTSNGDLCGLPLLRCQSWSY